MTLTRRTLAAALILAAAPAMAQQAAGPDPVAALRALYAKPDRAPVEPFISPRLRRLYEAQKRRGASAEGPMPGLDFGFACGCQDYDDNFHTRNRYRLVSRDDRRAKVTVTLKIFADQPETQDITFDLVLENGRWLIDEVTGASGDIPWVLSRLLQMRG
ncbi:MAG: DUF3828 domain-containing protein [Phreatobacter sp.]|nr:DUF3828 domain-containing protein [Phreatobacter sp.]